MRVLLCLVVIASALLVGIQSAPTTIPGVSQACSTAMDALNNNPNVTAAQQMVQISGCQDINYDDPNICQKTTTGQQITVTCTCIPILNNTNALNAVVTGLGGKVCPGTASVGLTGSATVNGNKLNIALTTTQQIAQPFLVPSQCTPQDIQAVLDSQTAAAVPLFKNIGTKLNAGFTTYSITLTACGATSTKSGNLPNSASIMGVSWLTLMGMVVALIMKQ